MLFGTMLSLEIHFLSFFPRKIISSNYCICTRNEIVLKVPNNRNWREKKRDSKKGKEESRRRNPLNGKSSDDEPLNRSAYLHRGKTWREAELPIARLLTENRKLLGWLRSTHTSTCVRANDHETASFPRASSLVSFTIDSTYQRPRATVQRGATRIPVGIPRLASFDALSRGDAWKNSECRLPFSPTTRNDT